MDRLLSCAKPDAAELVDESGPLRTPSSQTPTTRLSFRRRLPPIALLPCGQRPADPSPPLAESVDDRCRNGAVTAAGGCAASTAGSNLAWSGRVERLTERFDVVRSLGKGTFGCVLLAESRADGRQMALKKLPKSTTKLADFLREFNYGRQLSTSTSACPCTSASTGPGHPGILVTYDDAFETGSCYVFAQELAPCGDLLAALSPPNQGGLGDIRARRVASQVASALAFLHARRVVHRDVKPENVLLFDNACRLVKLADFGVARRCGTVVCRVCPGTAYTPPEICSRPTGRTYRVDTPTDVWAFGVVLFATLTASFPWRLARVDADDRLYADFVCWQEERRHRRAGNGDHTLRSASPLLDPWSRFAEPLVDLFHMLLDIDQERRAPIDVVERFVSADVTWLVRRGPAPPPGVVRRRRALAKGPVDDGGGELEDGDGRSGRPVDRSLMDATSRARRVSHWLYNGQLTTVSSVS